MYGQVPDVQAVAILCRHFPPLINLFASSTADNYSCFVLAFIATKSDHCFSGVSRFRPLENQIDLVKNKLHVDYP